jgi:zinc transport system ATP-binding protein
VNNLQEIIKINNVSFGYEKEDILLRDINFTVSKGDYIGVIGPNGSAKSTLLKLILGILKPIKGEISLFGQSINGFKEWNRIGYVSQKANSFNQQFPVTVEEVIKMQLSAKYGLRGVKANQLNKKIEDVLDLVGMKEYGDRLIGNLSGGQQQRVFIARALVNKPELLLLDEPTVGIDSESESIFYNILEKLNKQGISVLIITHDVGPICDNASKIACIVDKNLHLHDTKDSLTKEHLKSIYGYNVLGTINA